MKSLAILPTTYDINISYRSKHTMATVEHCLCCWEALAAALERRDALDLDQVQKSYAAYLADLSSSSANNNNKPPKKIPALRRLAGAGGSPASSSASSSSLGSTGSSSTSLSSNTAASSVSSSASTARAATNKNGVELVTDPEARYPLFVTWDKRHTSRTARTEDDDDDSDGDADDWQLRGCIGTFHDGDPLAETLAEYSLTSALRDTRFPRVALRELPALRCTVTLLTNFEDCGGDVDAWEVGVHGIRIKFTLDGRRYGATYLPSVAEEQGWTKEETMISLMRKAGWEGRRDGWRAAAAKGGMKVERYRGDKEEVAYKEYKAWRDWISQHWEKEGDEEEA